MISGRVIILILALIILTVAVVLAVDHFNNNLSYNQALQYCLAAGFSDVKHACLDCEWYCTRVHQGDTQVVPVCRLYGGLCE